MNIKKKAIKKAFDVIGIGNAIVDIIIHTDDSFLTKQGLIKGSNLLH